MSFIGEPGPEIIHLLVDGRVLAQLIDKEMSDMDPIEIPPDVDDSPEPIDDEVPQ